MEYRIEYANGRCRNYAHSRKDLLDKNGIEDSVLEKYERYIEK